MFHIYLVTTPAFFCTLLFTVPIFEIGVGFLRPLPLGGVVTFFAGCCCCWACCCFAGIFMNEGESTGIPDFTGELTSRGILDLGV